MSSFSSELLPAYDCREKQLELETWCTVIAWMQSQSVPWTFCSQKRIRGIHHGRSCLTILLRKGMQILRGMPLPAWFSDTSPTTVAKPGLPQAEHAMVIALRAQLNSQAMLWEQPMDFRRSRLFSHNWRDWRPSHCPLHFVCCSSRTGGGWAAGFQVLLQAVSVFLRLNSWWTPFSTNGIWIYEAHNYSMVGVFIIYGICCIETMPFFLQACLNLEYLQWCY